MIKGLATIPFLFIATVMNAQVVRWADKVLSVSSELTPIQYSADQILGKPNVLPNGGESPNAWAPDGFKKREFIKVGFSEPMKIRQVAVAESFNPSALYQVFAYDTEGKEYLISTQNPGTVPMRGRMLNIFIEETPYLVSAIKLEFDKGAINKTFGIDAIGIADIAYPIVADITKMKMLASGLVVEALGTNVNSEYSELNPIVSSDGKTLYFSRKDHPDNNGGTSDKEDIWYSVLDADNNWQVAENLKTLNTKGPNFVSSFHAATPDGHSAILLLGNKYLNNEKMMSGVSISKYENGQWTKPEALNIENDYNYNKEANYYLSNNQSILLMSIQREDSYGDRDIYVSFKSIGNNWSKPLNIGPQINTGSTESSPYLSEDGTKLYFSSGGFSGYGGSDIYVSHRLDDTWTNWTEPENLGPEINSPLEDVFFNIPSNSEYAYYSRGVSETNTDIFRIKLPLDKKPVTYVTAKGRVTKGDLKEGFETMIVATNLATGDKDSVRSRNGEYYITLENGSKYSIVPVSPNMLTESQVVDLTSKNKYQEMTLPDLQVEEIKAKATIVLNSLFFDLNKATIKSESHSELERLATLMNENPTMVVEIEGHTDNIGKESYNLELSKRRSNSVRYFLIEKNIDANRIKTTAFGESKPKASNDTEVGREQNRRVEFRIVSI